MDVRSVASLLLILLLSPTALPIQAQSPLSDAPRALEYSAPLLRGAWQTAMEIDSSGRLYLAGYICEASLPVTANAAQPNLSGGCDGFVAILGTNRQLQYATYLGGSQQERISAIAVDGTGNVYVGGDTGSANFPTTAGAFDRTFVPNGLDAFVTKLTPGGAIAYSTFLGGTGYEFVGGIAVDASGRAHVAGYTDSADFPTTAGALQRSPGGRDDGFYARLDASGAALQYSTYVGGVGSDGASDVKIDSTGAAYVAGGTESGDLLVMNAVQPTPGGAGDAWLMKIAPSGAVNYLTYFGGTTREALTDLTLQGNSVFLLGNRCTDTPPVTCNNAFIAQFSLDGKAVQRTASVAGLSAYAFGVDNRSRAYVVGYAEPTVLSPTPDAFQSTPYQLGSPMLVVLTMDSSSPTVQYASYLGGGGPFPTTVRVDGAGGIYFAGQFISIEGEKGTPVVNAPFVSAAPGGVVMHVVPEAVMVDNAPREVVMYAADVAAIHGNWQLEEDNSAALGRKLRNPNTGAAKLNSPIAAPSDYVEFEFYAESGVSYHLWMRGRADADNWANDSVFVQFSDSLDAGGAATARIGSASGFAVNLEDCTNCGVKGWGWQDNGYGANVLGPAIRFASTGTHTLRVQRREDGYAFDQIVLSAARFLQAAPGPLKQASTVLARSNGRPVQADSDVVLHMTTAQPHGAWITQSRSDAASGVVIRHPDAGAAKLTTMPAAPVNYVELSFDAEAGRPYHLWIRGSAERDYWGNDSVFVQFSDSVDTSGTARWRIGTTSAAEVNLEDCSGCGIKNWGWQDNGWGVGVNGPAIAFASSGRHVLRITTREDGFSIDQIVLSPGRYLTASPGALKNDTTILPKTQ